MILRLHLTTLSDDHVQIRYVLALVSGLGHLHLLDDVHAVDNLAEDGVLTIQEWCCHRSDEELRAVRVGAGVLPGRVSLF
jgi:hypothetical protein